MMYDFVLFENYHQAINHYKDICVIAKLLDGCGYKIAIGDTYKEGEYPGFNNYAHIVPKWRFDGFMSDCNHSLWDSLKYQWNVFKYYVSLHRFCKELKGQTKNVYAGSYHTMMPAWWLWLLPSNINFFFWGLRSSRLIEYKLTPFSLKGVNSFFLRKCVNRKQNIKFFISDELIKNEFISIGIPENRLVIRPERFMEKTAPHQAYHKDGKLKLLTIGSIRSSKRVELCIDALKTIKDENISYTIAGRTADAKYEEVIADHMKGTTNVVRLNYRIPEDEYNQLIETCDFLVLCDAKQLSNVTNGTMNEALLKGKPIIAPNYNPYKYYIEKYGIGIIYNPEEKTSLSNKIIVARDRGVCDFVESVRSYQETLLFDNLAKTFGADLSRVITN